MIVISSRQIVWTPIITTDSVAVALHPDFARACMAYKFKDDEEAGRIAQAAWRNMGKEGRFTPSNFFDFHPNGGLLLQGVYYGSDGIWLTLDPGTLSSKLRPIMYHGHNEDRRASDRMFLLHAFGEWVSSAQALLNWK